MEYSASLPAALKEEYGIMLEEVSPDALQAMGFQEVSADRIASFLQPFQYVPGLLSNQAIQDTYRGAFRLVLPPNLPVNAEMMPRTGLGSNLGSTIFRDAQSKKIVAQGGLEAIDSAAAAAPQIAYAAFSVASIATGQYFMKRIDGKLASIEQTSQEILQFLELEKRSELQAQQVYLREIFQNMDAIFSCSPQRSATIIGVQTIRRSTLSAIFFYQQKLHQVLGAASSSISEEKTQKMKVKDIEKQIQDALANVSGYWLSLYLYGYATMLEFLLTQNTNQTYLQSIEQDLEDKRNTYHEFYSNCKTIVLNNIQQLKTKEPFYNAAKLMAGFNVYLYERIKTSEENSVQKVKKQLGMPFEDDMEKWNSQYLDQIISGMGSLNLLYRSPVELAISGEHVYLKHSETAPSTP